VSDLVWCQRLHSLQIATLSTRTLTKTDPLKQTKMALWGQGDPRWIVEERPDSTNVNNWHWTERDATTWSKSKLKELFLTLKEDTDEGSWKIDEVKSVTGEATINNRKGKLIYFYEWELTLNYKGTIAGSELEHKGTITIPNLSDENDADDIDVQVIAKGDAKNAEKLKAMVRKNGIRMCKEMCEKYVADLKVEYSKGMVLQTKDAQKNGDKKNGVVEKKGDIYSRDIQNLSIQEQKKNENNNTSSGKEIKQSKEFQNMPANELYATLTQDDRLCAFTRSQCISNPVPGGEFSLLNGNITGKYTELVQDEKIVQTWRFKEWPPNVYSTVTMDLQQKSSGTKLKLTQTGIPEVDVVRTEKGWKMHFWEPIQQVFGFGRPVL